MSRKRNVTGLHGRLFPLRDEQVPAPLSTFLRGAAGFDRPENEGGVEGDGVHRIRVHQKSAVKVGFYKRFPVFFRQAVPTGTPRTGS